MNSETAKKFLPIVAALAQGKTIEKNWRCGGWGQVHEPTFDEPPEHYRIKPEPVTRRWVKPEEIPFPCFLRYKGCEDWYLALGSSPDYISLSFTKIPWCELNAWEHSTDRKTWRPCTVTEEAK